MQRRDFLKALSLSGLASPFYLSSGLLGLGSLASTSANASPISSRQVVQITLDGGPDLRHLITPLPSSTFGKSFWKNHFTAHELRNGNTDTVQTYWDENYDAVTLSGQTFGILKKAGWLTQQINRGKVGIISNVLGSPSRNHVRSLMALDYGRWDTESTALLGSGWGGRLAAEHTTGRVISLTSTPRNFCFGPSDTNLDRRARSDNLITLEDSRAAGLFDHRLHDDINEQHWRAVLSRAQASYYGSLQSKRTELPDHLQLLLDHERELRNLAENLDSILSSNPLPEGLANLDLEKNFHRQITTLYDLLNHTGGLLNMKVASLGLGSWDSHKHQADMIEPLLNTLFGNDQGLDMLTRHLSSSVKNNTVFMLSGEFGRQIRSNGDQGTDHGEGNYMLVIGEQVNGGLYGELFPNEEIARLEDTSVATPHIEGKTSLEHPFKALADWSLGRDSGTQVITRSLGDPQVTPRESGVSFAGLLPT
ncbi:DUF1501 domain-containing protein [Marinospirillum perlucidum]|uniref:DUF1501 domain-containing protein n=1 Tax=Marinospirillum perlucidum TaxID=1982602 RepID=UPI000DF12DCF|nr:DUF1501 domain-containing protein [Marinospirillum perlucidum]